MKKNLLFAMLFISTLANTATFAQSHLIHYWHFNNVTAPDSMFTYRAPYIAIDADYSLLDTSKAKLTVYLADAVNTNPFDSTFMDYYVPTSTENDTMNLRMGQTTGNAIKARNPMVNMELRLYIPTTNYKNIVIKFGTEASGSALWQQAYDYSTDSGLTWHTSGLSLLTDTARATFGLVALNIYHDLTVNNNSKLVFRMKFTGNVNQYSGNNRFDNFTIEGDDLTAPNASVPEVAFASNNFVVYPNPVTTTLNIASELEGNKTVMVYDIAGKTVFAGLASGKEFAINVVDLVAGTYIVAVRDNATGKVSNLKFNKI